MSGSRRVEARHHPAWITYFSVALVFGVAYGQYPLYYFTQNQYFFHGLVRAGFGLLRNDWLAGTPDPWPAFSALVQLTYRYLGEPAFYTVYVLLLGVYAYSVMGIVSTLFGAKPWTTRWLAYLAAMTALHAPMLGRLLGIVNFNPSRVFVEGVASQMILMDMLQPQAFGAFLLLSIHLFLRGKPFQAILASGASAAFHPVLLLSVGVLTLSYMVVMFRRGEGVARPLALGSVALALLLPVLTYSYILFGPTAPEAMRAAQEVLYDRLSFHTMPAVWLGTTAYLKVAMIVAALYVVRRTELFTVMLISFAVAAGLTLVQIATGSVNLALIFPWRLSVYLVPLSSLIVLAAVLFGLLGAFERRFPRRESVLVALAVAVLVMTMADGAVETARRFARREQRSTTGIMRFIKTSRAPGDTYLIPMDWREFRLYTGAPAFIEHRFIPYDDAAVVEWHKRIGLLTDFYSAKGDGRCSKLRALSAEYRITHVVLGNGELGGCGEWKRMYADTYYALYAVTQ